VSKLKFILSDLHLGVDDGCKSSHILDNFSIDVHLGRFLHQLRAESEQDQREIELIINGDFLDFLQVPAVDHYTPTGIYPPQAYLDSSQDASLQRLNLIVNRHQPLFEALAHFMQAETPKRRLTIIKGNHDAALYWPLVKSRLREVLDASGRRSSLLLFAAEFINREKIYVEHGHQRTEQINRFPDFHDPRLPDNPVQLYYPPGSYLYVDLFNEVRHDRRFSDGIKPITALIWLALRWDFDLAAKMLISLIGYTTAGQIASPVTASALEPGLLVNQLVDEHGRRRLAEQYNQDVAFRAEFHRQIQPYLTDLEALLPDATSAAPEEFCGDPVVMGQAEQSRQKQNLQVAAAEIARQQKAAVIVFGHTHQPVCQSLAGGGLYLNTGCWLGPADLTTAPFELWAALFHNVLKPGDGPIKLPYARIDYDEQDQPAGQLLDFVDDEPVAAETTAKSTGFLTRLLNRFTVAL
jgi:UDP-2,3-diacylglucosamine pyrophosphatase LpxH